MSKNDDLKNLQKAAERVLGQPVEDFFFTQRPSVRTSNSDAYVQEREPVIDGVDNDGNGYIDDVRPLCPAAL